MIGQSAPEPVDNDRGKGQPDISVVVAIIDGGDALRACLLALSDQMGGWRTEVIIPYDQLSREVAAMADEFPNFHFLDLGVILGGMTPKNALQLHQFWDVRQSEGIKNSHGRLVGLVTDRGVPAKDWVASIIELQNQTGAAAVGGCIDNGNDTVWHWATHICDFARYLPPKPTGESTFLSATNVCYVADKLHAHRALYERRFYEPSIHAALMSAGEKLILSDCPRTTEYRPRIPTLELVSEWFHWGRKYGGIRAGQLSLVKRVFRAAVTPLLPFVLYCRHLGNLRRKKILGRNFWLASPLIILIVSMWALGEFVGYIQGPEPESK